MKTNTYNGNVNEKNIICNISIKIKRLKIN